MFDELQGVYDALEIQDVDHELVKPLHELLFGFHRQFARMYNRGFGFGIRRCQYSDGLAVGLHSGKEMLMLLCLQWDNFMAPTMKIQQLHRDYVSINERSILLTTQLCQVFGELLG